MAIRKNKWVVNSLLLLTGVTTALSGIIIQLGYHIGNSDNTTPILGLDYYTWSTAHKVTIIIFMLFCIYHIYVHWKWYKTVVVKQTLRKKNRQTLLFSGLFIVSALTGIAPWIMDSIGSYQHFRLQLVEIHDKISLLLIVSIILHVIKRIKRFA